MAPWSLERYGCENSSDINNVTLWTIGKSGGKIDITSKRQNVEKIYSISVQRLEAPGGAHHDMANGICRGICGCVE
jgi:hypothetical protein